MRVCSCLMDAWLGLRTEGWTANREMELEKWSQEAVMPPVDAALGGASIEARKCYFAAFLCGID